MKNAILIVCFFIHLYLLNAQDRYDIQLIVEGRVRECIVVKPSKSPPNGGYPVVIMLHGTAQNGEQFYNISGWKELGSRKILSRSFPRH